MKINAKNAWLGLPVLILALGVAGCESDSVTPNDNLPPVSAENSAKMAVVVSTALTEVAPLIYDPSKEILDFTLSGDDINGTVHIDFRDGPDGAAATAAEAAWAHLYTDAGAPVVADISAYGGEAAFALDIMGTIGRDPDMVTILEGSGGSITSGDRSTAFTIDGLVIDGGSYPASGSVAIIPDSGPRADITFDGTNVAQALVGGIYYDVNLDTGDVTETVIPI